MSRLKLTEGGKSLRITLRPKKKNSDGKLVDAKVDGVPSWTVHQGNEVVIRVTPAEDGMSAIFAPRGPGSFSVAVSADADLGEGVAPIAQFFDGDVESAIASLLEFDAEEIDAAA
jgi:hypothetical protein